MTTAPRPSRRLEHLLDVVRIRAEAGAAVLSDEEFNEVLRLICLRRLDDVEVDEVHLHVTSRASGTVIVTATGRDWAGRLQPLGIVAGDALTGELATTFLLSLRRRGLRTPARVTSNAPEVFGPSAAEVFPGSVLARPDDSLSRLDLERLGNGDLATVLSPVPGTGPSGHSPQPGAHGSE